MIEIDQHPHAVRADGKKVGGPDPSQVPCAHSKAKGQRGAVAVLFAVMIIVVFGFIGLAFDLSLLHNRKVELQTLADTAAVAAANQLVGTSTGVQNALTAAAEEAANFRYDYHSQSVIWSNSAIKFSASPTAPDGSWLDAGAALSSPSGLLFAKVDTSALDSVYGTINTWFMRVLSDAQATASTSARALAGRSSINVTPLAICALSLTQANPRSNAGPTPNVELEEYGFRRGVGYDLMNLNPNSTTTAENFVVDPIAPLGGTGSSSNTSAATVGPFVCTGRMPMPRVMGSTIAVSRPFPLSSLFNQLNSRFDQYAGGLCNPNQAQPDANVKAYVYNTSIPWMTTAPTAQTAATSTQGGTLWTVASPSPAPAGTTAPVYGPLWSFAKAVPYSAYTAGVPEPGGGYATFATGAWTTLYNPGQPTVNGYPATTPYSASAGANFQAPALANRPGLRFRRVLNVPLLSCPVAAGANVTATVLAIGRFFMTVPATSSSISAEFAGVVPEQSLGGPVELFR